MLRHIVGRTSPVRRLWVAANEWMLGIDTVERGMDTKRRGRFSERQLFADGLLYGSLDYWYLYRTLIDLDLKLEDVVYDLGCGRGRIVCAVARLRVKKCIGIEIQERLCEAARANASKLRGKRSPIEILEQDCAAADLSDGTVYFFSNPFGSQTMKVVLENIRQSLTQSPRLVRIAYYAPVCLDLFASCAWLKRTGGIRTLLGSQITFWKSSVNP